MYAVRIIGPCSSDFRKQGTHRLQCRLAKEKVAILGKTNKLVSMTVIESIIKELESLPNAKLVEVAGFVHRLSDQAQQERAEALRRLHGSLSEPDGEAFEEALRSARQF